MICSIKDYQGLSRTINDTLLVSRNHLQKIPTQAPISAKLDALRLAFWEIDMLPAKDFFPDWALEQLWKDLGLVPNPKQPAQRSAEPKARLIREQRGSCTVLRFSGDMAWEERVTAVLWPRR
jgi:hypothetical protein